MSCKKIFLLFIALIMCFSLVACSSAQQNSTDTFDETGVPVEIDPAEERFYEYAKQYNAIKSDDFYEDAYLELDFTTEILKKYKGSTIAKYYLPFDDIISDNNGNYIGIHEGFHDLDYYYFPAAFYDDIIKHEGTIDGVIFTLKNITPIYQPSYIDGESEFDVSDPDNDGEAYGDIEINADISYSLNHKYEFEIIDIYYDGQ